MASHYWIKLYIEILDDPKMGKLPDSLFRRAIELFLLAGEFKKEGLLQPIEDIAWRLRSSPEEVVEALNALSRIGIARESPDGWLITNFAKRQEASSSANRVRNYRERRNADVTNRFALGNSPGDSLSTS